MWLVFSFLPNIDALPTMVKGDGITAHWHLTVAGSRSYTRIKQISWQITSKYEIVYLSVCACLCVSLHACTCVYLYVYVCQCVRLYVSVCDGVSPTVWKLPKMWVDSLWSQGKTIPQIIFNFIGGNVQNSKGCVGEWLPCLQSPMGLFRQDKNHRKLWKLRVTPWKANIKGQAPRKMLRTTWTHRLP